MNTLTINNTTVVLGDKEYETLNKASKDFNDLPLDKFRFNGEVKHKVITFSELNQPEPDTEELNISVFGDLGEMLNSEADKLAIKEFGVYFSVLIFLDGCNYYFRTSHEEEN